MPIRRSPNGAGHTRPQPGRDRPEWVVAINRNARSQSIGIGGRNQPVRAPMQNSLVELWGLVQYVEPTGTLGTSVRSEKFSVPTTTER